MESNQPGQEPSLRQTKSALLEAAQAAIVDQRTKAQVAAAVAATVRPRRRGLGLLIFLTVVAVGGAGVLLLQPAWLVGVRPPEEPPAVVAASSRLALIEAAARVRHFSDSAGRLPAALGEAGVTDTAIALTPLEGLEFSLARRAGDSLISLRSTDSLKPLVAASVRTLQARPRP